MAPSTPIKLKNHFGLCLNKMTGYDAFAILGKTSPIRQGNTNLGFCIMHKNFVRSLLIMAASCGLAGKAQAENTASWESVGQDDLKTTCELSQGYRKDNLKWSIAGPHKRPNVLSELHWKDVKIHNTHLGLCFSKEHLFTSIDLAYGKVHSGKVHDRDWAFNNRKGLFSHSVSKVPHGHTLDGTVKIGMRLFPHTNLRLSPSIGYGAYEQKLSMKHGVQRSWMGHKMHKKLPKNLDSSYRARWYGPQVGLEAGMRLSESVSLAADYNFLFPLKYTGKGHWNLRERGARHFTHNAHAYKSFGHMGKVGANWEFADNWALKAECELMKFYAKGGRQGPKRQRVPFNKANRTSTEYRLTLAYAF